MKNTKLLAARMVLYNMTAIAGLVLAEMHGYVDMVFAGDPTGITALICIVFLFGSAICFKHMLIIGQAIDGVKSSKLLATLNAAHERGTASTTNLKMALSARIASVRHIASSLVILGLIGTVLGFIIALSGIDPDTASDVTAIPTMVATLVTGMSTALYTTLVGSILNMWLMMNYYMMNTALVKLMHRVFK